jgi:hypothetical protein
LSGVPREKGSTFGSGPFSYPEQIRFSDQAEKYLCQLADDLVRGRVGLHQLPASLFAVWTYGFVDGSNSRQAEVERLNHENDQLFLRAYNSPEEVKRIIARRVDQGLEEYADAFFAAERQKTGTQEAA